MQKRRLKIIFDPGHEVTAAHARKLLKALEADIEKHPRAVPPRGVAAYAALEPEVCEDCGETFWQRPSAAWAPHYPCPGPRKRQWQGF